MSDEQCPSFCRSDGGHARGEKNDARFSSVIPPEPSSRTCGWRALSLAAVSAIAAGLKLSSMTMSAPACTPDKRRARRGCLVSARTTRRPFPSVPPAYRNRFLGLGFAADLDLDLERKAAHRLGLGHGAGDRAYEARAWLWEQRP